VSFHRNPMARKSLVRWTAFLFLPLIPCLGCSKPRTDPVSLELRLKKGETYQQISNSELKIQMGSLEPKIEIDMKFIAGLTQQVQDVAANGNITVKVTHDWLEAYGKTPGKERHVDTRALESVDQGSSFAAIPGQAFEAVTDAKGLILSISDSSPIFELLERAGVDLMRPGSENSVPKLSAEEKKQMLQQFPYFPPHPVKIGEHWQAQFKSRHLLYFDGTVDFVLSQLKQGKATIDFTLTASPFQPDSGGEDPSSPKLKLAVRGDGKGQIIVREDTGAILLYDRNDQYSGEAIQTIPGRAEPLRFPVQAQKTIRLEDHSS